MTQDRIIELAREAGLISSYGGREIASDDLLQRFAALVRNATLEEAAGVCDDKAMHCETKAQEAIEAGEYDEVSAIRSTAWQLSVCAAAIRALKGKT